MSEYWYIKHVEHGPVSFGSGAALWGKDSAWLPGIHDRTVFETKELAKKVFRDRFSARYYTRDFRKKFRFVKVTVTARGT